MLTGQLEPCEREQLENHLSVCPDCRSEFSDIAQMVAALTSIANKKNPVAASPGLTERFIARARSEGIPLSSRKHQVIQAHNRFTRSSIVAVIGVAALVLFGFGPLLLLMRERRQTVAGSVGSAISAVDQPVPVDSEPIRDDKALQENAKLRAHIQSLEGNMAALSVKLNVDQNALQAARSEIGALKSELTNAVTDESDLHQNVADRDAQVAQLKRDVEKLQALKDSDTLAFKVEEAELNTLREQVTKLNVKLEESEQLSAAANQAKDLIVARRLHIVDVDDTDENGKQQRPFGRIFYTEGKKLVFYAYDLGDPRRLDAKINFYVWGGREGLTTPVKSLGIFHSDDASAGRWVLQFDDPNVLAQINCIFVTAESGRKAVTQPTGRQLLFASLGKTVNHP